MRAVQFLCLVAAVAAFAAVTAVPRADATAECIQVSTPADLDNVRNDLAGNYCLANDIDMSGVADFQPITNDQGAGFAGTFDGQGHAIKNLTITSPIQHVGLFSSLFGLVKNLMLQNATVSGSDPSVRIGTLAGIVGEPTPDTVGIINVHVSGEVRANCVLCVAGGLVGEINGSISQSSAAVVVTDGAFGAAGGLIGVGAGTVSRSYATGAVSITPDANGSTSGQAGGLVGAATNVSIIDSFATGSVSAPGEPLHGANFVGGLVGDDNGGVYTRSFATGPVTTGAAVSSAGGLIGRTFSTTLRQVYSVGPVFTTSGGPSGGLVGDDQFDKDTLQFGYWDTQTSGFATSAEGVGLTTAQLQRKLPKGFKEKNWTMTPGVSFPYLTAAGLHFAAPLAIVVKNNLLYTFLPISQLDKSQYAHKVKHQDEASLATAYTIIARAIGITDDVRTLQDAPIDTYWDDKTEHAQWRGAVTDHATRGSVMPLSNAEPIDENNVIGPLRARQAVIVRGTFKKAGGGKGKHWMLATSFVTDDAGNIVALVADDPWTGLQVQIDPETKQVVEPPDFPLAHFKLDAFQTVTLD
jgi:hypothetical protein